MTTATTNASRYGGRAGFLALAAGSLIAVAEAATLLREAARRRIRRTYTSR